MFGRSCGKCVMAEFVMECNRTEMMSFRKYYSWINRFVTSGAMSNIDCFPRDVKFEYPFSIPRFSSSKKHEAWKIRTSRKAFIRRFTTGSYMMNERYALDSYFQFPSRCYIYTGRGLDQHLPKAYCVSA